MLSNVCCIKRIGASGVLGTAIYAAFKAAGHNVLGLAHSRATGDLKKVNLLDNDEIDAMVKDFHPDCEPIIVCDISPKRVEGRARVMLS